jgi:hypothetical protein
MRRDCQMCMAERPKQYVIVAGASKSASARMTTVDCREQARLAARSSNAPAVGKASVAEVVAGVAMEPVHGARRNLLRAGVGMNCLCQEHREQEHQAALREAAAEEVALKEPIAEGVPVLLGGRGGAPSHAGVVPHRVVIERLVGTLIDVVGTNANDCGRACSRHSCCGAQVAERTMVAFCRKQLVFCNGCMEDLIVVYLCKHGVLTCKVGFLPAHLNRCARDYDGLVARVMSVYTDQCTNVVKRQKFWRNKGCCTARIVGEHVAA